MNVKKLKTIYILSIFPIVLCKTISFVDVDCLYVEDGVGFSKIDEPVSIDFYIPHNWKASEDDLNNLHLRLYNTSLTLRHPSSSENETDGLNLPLSEIRIGWNTIYLRKTEDKLEVLMKTLKEKSSTGNENSEEHWKVIQNVTQEEFNYADPFYVSGLYALVNCKGSCHMDIGSTFINIKITLSVFGVFIVVLFYVFLYLKYYYNQNNRRPVQARRVNEEYFPFPAGIEGYVVSAGPPRIQNTSQAERTRPSLTCEMNVNEKPVVDSSYLAPGSEYFDFDVPRVSNATTTEENYYEEYHYYERYHPEDEQEVKPECKNKNNPVSN